MTIYRVMERDLDTHTTTIRSFTNDKATAEVEMHRLEEENRYYNKVYSIQTNETSKSPEMWNTHTVTEATYIPTGEYEVAVCESTGRHIEIIMLSTFNIWDNANRFIPFAYSFAKEISERDNKFVHVEYKENGTARVLAMYKNGMLWEGV